MVKFSGKVLAVSIGAAIAVLQLQLVMALTDAEIDAKAEGITVRIDGRNRGSGVIVEKEGSNPICYTVLTNWHVVGTPGDYVVEIGGNRYTVNSSQIRQIRGVDLALLSFQSSYNYVKAILGDSNQSSRNMRVYVAGWADGDDVARDRRYLFTGGNIIEVLRRPINEGYTLRYNSLSQPGMSGGPVLNEKGEVIGINGSGRGGAMGFLGIPINTFLVWNQRFGRRSPCGISRTPPTPRPVRPELTGFPKSACGHSNPSGLQTFYPVYVDYSADRLRQIRRRFCNDADRSRDRESIQVASFRDRSIAEEFARRMTREFGSGFVGDEYRR